MPNFKDWMKTEESISFCYVIVIAVIIKVMIALKDANQDFCNLLTVSWTVSNIYTRVDWAQLCANHMGHIERLSPVTCVCHVIQRDSSAIKFDRVELAFILALFIGWTSSQWRRGGNQSTQRKPLMMSFRKCHILKPENSGTNRDLNPHPSIGSRLKKQMCYLLHHRLPRVCWT